MKNEEKLMGKEDIIYDHYKETCKLCRNNEKDRNKLFIIVCILLTLLFLFIVAETSIAGMLYAWIKDKYDYDLTLSVETIQSLVWILLLYFTIRYYQQCIGIERLYQYIHSMEEKLSKELNFDITREGKSYLQEYPWVLNFIWFIYTIFFPSLYLFLILIKIGIEIYRSVWSWNFYLHIVLAVCDIILTVLFSLFLHKGNIEKLFRRKN